MRFATAVASRLPAGKIQCLSCLSQRAGATRRQTFYEEFLNKIRDDQLRFDGETLPFLALLAANAPKTDASACGAAGNHPTDKGALADVVKLMAAMMAAMIRIGMSSLYRVRPLRI